jgi:hypothetical protein
MLLTSYPAQNPLGAHFDILDSEEQFLPVYDTLSCPEILSYSFGSSIGTTTVSTTGPDSSAGSTGGSFN